MTRAVALACALALPMTAVAKKPPPALEAIAASEVAALIRDKGHQVEQVTDSVGDPLLKVKGAALTYAVLFYDCEASTCGSLQFRVYWSEADISFEKANAFHQERRIGRLYKDQDGDPTFETVLWLDGGVQLDHIRAHHDRFVELAGEVGTLLSPK